MVRPAPIKAGMAQAGLADTVGADARGLIATAHATPSCGASHTTHALDARHHLLRAPPQVPATTFAAGRNQSMQRAIHFWSKAFVDFCARATIALILNSIHPVLAS